MRPAIEQKKSRTHSSPGYVLFIQHQPRAIA